MPEPELPPLGASLTAKGRQDKPKGLWDSSKLPEVMPSIYQWRPFPAELPTHQGNHLCIAMWWTGTLLG